jgi:hypothetical protein
VTASAIEYYKILLDILIAAIISIVLIIVTRRNTKEKILTGYRTRSKDEKYIGYALLSGGIIIMALSIVELILLSCSNFYSNIPFGLCGIQLVTASQTTEVISGQLLGLSFGGSFWLLIFGCGGAKLISLGMDLLRGTQLKIIKKLRI